MKSRQKSVVDERLVLDGLAVEATDQWNLENTVNDVHAAVEIFANLIELAASIRYGY